METDASVLDLLSTSNQWDAYQIYLTRAGAYLQSKIKQKVEVNTDIELVKPGGKKGGVYVETQ